MLGNNLTIFSVKGGDQKGGKRGRRGSSTGVLGEKREKQNTEGGRNLNHITVETHRPQRATSPQKKRISKLHGGKKNHS